jgi:predicted RNA-binding protein
MADNRHQNPERTAVDDVRRVREKIARENGGNLRKHVEETNRVTAGIRAKLKVKVVPASGPATRRAGTDG